MILGQKRKGHRVNNVQGDKVAGISYSLNLVFTVYRATGQPLVFCFSTVESKFPLTEGYKSNNYYHYYLKLKL